MRLYAILPLLTLACSGVSVQPDAPQSAEPSAVRVGQVPPHGPYAVGFDALHYAIDIETHFTADSARKVITARAVADILVRENGRDSVRLDITGLTINSVQVARNDGKFKRTEFTHIDGRLFVPIDATAGDTLHVEVRYSGTPDNGLIIRRNVNGAPGAFADNWPDRARFWIPTIDHPSDKATAEFRVTTRPEFEVIANGFLVDTTSANGKRTWHYRIDRPIPTYLMVIGVTDFAIGTLTTCAKGGDAPPHNGCVPVTYWAYPQDSANAARIFARAPQMLEYYSELIAPFPYKQLAHVQSSTIFGGMENAGAIFYTEQGIKDGTMGEGLIAHEVAHQWFGDDVTPAHWSHVWLSEGFATYFGMLFFEHADGIEVFRKIVRESAEGYLKSTVQDIAIVDSTSVPGNDLVQLLNANSYQKGGAVLHMLRGLIGDDAFFGASRRYYRTHRLGNVRTQDFQRAVEQESGRDLDWFFRQWIYSPGHPILASSYSWDAAAGEAVVTIEQVQKREWPVFRMPLEIEFQTPAGVVRQRIQITGPRESHRFKLAGPPTGMRLDPDGWLLFETR